MEEIRLTATKEMNVNGVSLAYVEQGTGSPVILVHGNLSDYRMWEGQMGPFSQQHRVIAYSRRYAYPGRATDDSVGYTVVPHAKDLAALIQQLNAGPVHLVGHSYGAYTALLTAIEHPELVKSLCLGEPPAMSLLTNTEEGNVLLFEFETNTVLPAAQAYNRGDDLTAVKIFLDGVMGKPNFYDTMPPEVQQQIWDNMQELRGIVTSSIIFLPPFITCADVRKVKAPILLITGDSSPKLMTAIITELERCLSNKERVTLSHASHEMEMDNPQEFNEAVLRFIQKHEHNST
ncbi:MAG: alpha/beta hydrolase [Hymenobacteraceae bacterium]|nr:alpha/beta hydrolase [Hymenobacteraceae bacterium]